MVQFFDPAQEQEIKRRRRMAEQLQAQAAPQQTQIVSGYAVPQSGLEALAKGLSGGYGAYQGARADSMEEDLAKNRQALLTEALAKLGTDQKGAGAMLAQDPSMLAAGLGLITDANKTDRAQILADAEFRQKKELAKEAAAERNKTAGIKSGQLITDASGNVVPNPKPPQAKLSATQQKELFDTTDMIAAGQSALKNLEEADLIRQGGVAGSDIKPYSGFGAETITSLEGVPILGMLANKERAAKTTDYTNLVKTQALDGLKASVGANPTEGERKIILELQALASYQEEQQKEILSNAMNTIKRRVAMNQQKADFIQSGDFQGLANMTKAAPTAPAADPLASARDAIAKGADPEAVKRRLQENGIATDGL